MLKDTLNEINDSLHENSDLIGDVGVIASNVGSWSVDVWVGLAVSCASMIYVGLKMRNENIKRKKSKEEWKNEKEKHQSEIEILKLQLEKEKHEVELAKHQLDKWKQLTDKDDTK